MYPIWFDMALLAVVALFHQRRASPILLYAIPTVFFFTQFAFLSIGILLFPEALTSIFLGRNGVETGYEDTYYVVFDFPPWTGFEVLFGTLLALIAVIRWAEESEHDSLLRWLIWPILLGLHFAYVLDILVAIEVQAIAGKWIYFYSEPVLLVGKGLWVGVSFLIFFLAARACIRRWRKN